MSDRKYVNNSDRHVCVKCGMTFSTQVELGDHLLDCDVGDVDLNIFEEIISKSRSSRGSHGSHGSRGAHGRYGKPWGVDAPCYKPRKKTKRVKRYMERDFEV